MFKLIIFFLITSSTWSQELLFPVLEDFQLDGFQNVNFTNVLLNPESDISNFWAITDVGLLYRVSNLGVNTETEQIMDANGTISEAFTYDSIHYLSINSNGNCYLIKTKDFLTIDTLLYESNTSINDFRIYNDSIFVLTVNNGMSTIIYKSLENKIWSELSVTIPNYNRIVKIDNYIYLYKYLDNDISLLRNVNLTNEWEFIGFQDEELLQIARIKQRDTVLYFCGKFKPNGLILVHNKNIERIHGFGLSGTRGINTMLDFEFDFDFRLRKNFNDIYQIGYSDIDGEGAYFNKPYFQGNGEGNKILYPYSSSLNRIITNDYSQNKEFVAVGDNGFVLLINRGTTPVEYDWDNLSTAGLSFFPNPTDGIINIRNASEQIFITNITGNIVKTIAGASQVDLSDLPSGVYLVRIGDKIEKLIKY